MNKQSPIVSEFDTVESAEAYERWLHAKVAASLADTRPAVPHHQAMARCLTSALSASEPSPTEDIDLLAPAEEIITTEEEVAGFNIIRAIAAKSVDLKRIVMRDAKSHCAVLLDDNNRKTIARLHFNSLSVKYLGTFTAKEETRHLIAGPTDIYGHADSILARIDELVKGGGD